MLQSHYTKLKEAGCDEAGRGCLAGPVVAAAVILPHDYQNAHLNDSKQLSESKRNALEENIKSDALAWAVGEVDNEKIDEINILNASFYAMHLAIDQLKSKPEFLLIDGNRFKPYPDIEHQCFVKGDGRFLSIAAASILAKNHRDRLMAEMHNEFPAYNWQKNKGYPTTAHRSAIRDNGPSPYHRKSFKLLDDQLSLF